MDDQLCWSCKRYAGGCPWTEWDLKRDKIRFEPVPGWTAIRTRKTGIVDMSSYQIIDCPLYDWDGSERMEIPGPAPKHELGEIWQYMRSGMTDNEIMRRTGIENKDSLRNYKSRARKKFGG